MIVWPVSASIFIRKDGSSPESCTSAFIIFSPSAFVFGSIATADDGIGVTHRFELNQVFRVAERVPRMGVLQPHHGDDVARENLVDILALVRVHSEKSAHALLAIARSVDDLAPGSHRSRIDAHVVEASDVFIGLNLENVRREGGVVQGRPLLFLLGVGIDPLCRRDIARAREVRHDRVEHLLNALVLESRSAEHGNDLGADRALADRLVNLLERHLGAMDDVVHDPVVQIRERVHQDVPRLRGPRRAPAPEYPSRGTSRRGLPVIVNRLHRDQVDDALEGIARSRSASRSARRSRRVSRASSSRRSRNPLPTRSILLTNASRGM